MLDLNPTESDRAADQDAAAKQAKRKWTKSDLDILARALADCASRWVPDLFPNARIENGEYRLGSIDGSAPGKSGSLVIPKTGEHAGSWKDFSTGEGGGQLSLLGHATGLRGDELFTKAIEIIGHDPTATRANDNGHANGHSQSTSRARTSAERNQAQADFLWAGATPLAGTLAETYLAARGLPNPQSEDLRYAASAAHHATKTGWPTLISLWRDPVTLQPTGGIHRTYLMRDGSWHAGHEPGFGKAKLSLGPSEGVVMLGPPTASGDLAIGEGLETTLAGAILFAHDPNACWYGGTGAMRRLAKAIEAGIWPNSQTARVKRLLVLQDKGADGSAASLTLAAAAEAQGIEAWVAMPAPSTDGSDNDFADDLLSDRRPPSPVRYSRGGSEAPLTGTPHSLPPPLAGQAKDRLTQLIDEFNAQYAVVNEAGKVFVYEQSHDPIRDRSIIVRISFADFNKMYQNYWVTVSIGGKNVTKNAADWWLGSPRRRQYLNGVVFDPTDKVDKTKYWNLWKGFSVEPKKGDWSLMKNHILNVICSGEHEHYDYLIGWIARSFQMPQIPGDVAVVIRGEKGSGKGTLATWLVKAWGQHGLHIHSSKHLVGNFNLHLRDAVLLFADEAFFAGDKTHEPVLKGLITDPTITIEGKGQNIVECINMLHVIMASNSDWVVPATQRERRYFVVDINDSKVGNRKYFADLYNQMQNGGLAAMIYDMLEYDISEYEVRDIPQTKALMDQKNQSLDTLDRWLRDILERGFVFISKYGVTEFKNWIEWVSRDLMIASYLQWCSKNRVNYPASGIMLGKRLRSVYPFNRSSREEIIGEVEAMVSSYTIGTSDPVVRKARPDGFRLGDLDTARETFAQVRGVAIEPAEDE